MSSLVLVRHGESLWNVERRVQGQSGSELSERGRWQADLTGRLLEGMCEEPPLLASSDLDRAMETAEFVAKHLRVDIRTDERLRERAFGDWTNRLVVDIEREDRERWDRWRRGEDVIAEVGGEDSAMVVARVRSALRDLAADADGRRVVCVTHGGAIWHGTQALLGLRERVLGGVANCSVTEIGTDGDRAWLVAWNQVAHLPPELREIRRAVGGRPAGEPEARDEPSA